jgi:hypothetical protein
MRLSRPQTVRRRGIAWPQSCLALVLLSLGGCAWVSGEAVRQDLLAGRSRGRYIDGVPFIPQGRPVIVFQDQGIGPLAFPHFFVVIGYDDARELIIAHSGVTENRLISYREFLWTWGKKGNWALRIWPKDRAGGTPS